MNILIYKGQFAYDVVNLFTDNTVYFLEKRGNTVTVIDTFEEDALEKVIQIFSTEIVDLVISFGTAKNPKLNTGEPLYDAVNTTLLGIYVDHPSHHMDTLTENVKNFLCSFIDKEHVKYINEILPTHHKISFFLPHAGFTEIIEKDFVINDFNSYEGYKEIDILFSGTYPENSNKKLEILEKIPKYILDEVCERLIYDDYSVVHETFFEVCTKYGIKFSTIGKVQLSNLLVEIIDYVRSYKRMELIKKIVESNLNITICGFGWTDFVKNYKNINYIGEVDIKENINLIRKAKLLVNTTPNFTNGSHERVFNGMLNNTVIFTDRSKFYDEYFKEGKEILYYSFNSLDEDINKLKVIVKDNRKLYNMSKKAYDITIKYHTWENRVDRMLEMVNLSKMMDK